MIIVKSREEIELMQVRWSYQNFRNDSLKKESLPYTLTN
jgi:hypothetical protein